MEEIWKDIKGYDGLYQVSNLGNVKSLNFNHFPNKQKILKPRNAGRYNKQNVLIHRLVAEAFIPNPNNYPCINHKNKNTYDNKINNLEWCTHKYNMRYSLAKKVNQYDLQGNYIKTWDCIKDASNELNIRNYSISLCCKGKYKNVGGFKWKYTELKENK